MEKLKYSKYVISFTFGDYKHTIGGVAKVVSAHQKMFNDSKISYICVYPFNLSNRKFKKNNRFWGVVIDGVFRDVYSTEGLIRSLCELDNIGFQCECIHVHHFLHIDINELVKVIKSLNAKIYFYIHDYYTICSSAKLIGEDGALCRSDFLDSERCRQCKYYETSINLKKVFTQFVKEFESRIMFLCPSESCKDWFLRQYKEYSEKVIVVYHQTPKGEYVIPRNRAKKIKIGYVGVPIPAKGWTQFKELYNRYNNGKYEFVYFSSIIDHTVEIRNVSVNFQSSLNAMVDALRKECVDFVLLWSIWPETYSYTYYESYSSGCCILTNPDSGNIAYQVKKMQSGCVFSEDQLFDFFADDKEVREYRNSYVATKGSVYKDLFENDSIVSMSVGKTSSINCLYSDRLMDHVVGKILKLVYILKIKLKTR